MFQLYLTRSFERQAAKFVRSHPNLRGRLAQTLIDLENDPFQPHLRLHPLKGELVGLHAVRLTFGYRITLTLRLTEQEITLLDIGSHDEVYR